MIGSCNRTTCHPAGTVFCFCRDFCQEHLSIQEDCVPLSYQEIGTSLINDRNIVEALYRTHDYLLRNLSNPIRRSLFDEIDFSAPLIGIYGCRGVGKTTFLLDYAARTFGSFNRKCLYVNLNNFLFTRETLVDFAKTFYDHGGRHLLLDQIYKYPSWHEDLLACMRLMPDLQIVYTTSIVQYDTALPIEEQLPGAIYRLDGFSLREFIQLKAGLELPQRSLTEILSNHETISREVMGMVNPLNYLADYTHHGYYPFFLEDRNYSENLLKNINMMLEVDVSFLRNLDQRLLPKLRRLLYELGRTAPTSPNVSQLSQMISASRATISNYMHILSDAGLITQLYRVGTDSSTRKPAMCYLQNTNIGYALVPEPVTTPELYSTFFLTHLNHAHQVNAGGRTQVHFIIDETYEFRIDKELGGRYRPDRYYAVQGIPMGHDNVIPLWLFGFIY